MEDGRKDSSGTIILNEEEDEPLVVVTSSNGGLHVYVVPHLGYVGCRSRAGESIIIIIIIIMIIIKGTLLL